MDWMFDETKVAGVNYTQKEEAENYDRTIQKVRDYRRETEQIREYLRLRPEHVILEIGAGTAELAVHLSPYCRTIHAVDVSPAMLEIARRKIESQNLTNIEFATAGFLNFPCRESSFDGAVSQLALHHLPDGWKRVALDRIYQSLKPQGRFYLMDVVFPTGVEHFDKHLEQLIGSLPDPVIRHEMTVHIREEYSTFDWIMKGLLEEAGFSIEESRLNNGFIGEYVCVKY